MNRPVRLLPVVLVLCAASPLALPAHAATTYSPCLAQAQDGAISASCVTQSSLGPVSSPPPPGEYLDPWTGLVYAQTDHGFAPVGTGLLPQFAEQISVGWSCDASDGVGCFSTTCTYVENAPYAPNPGVPPPQSDNGGASCQETRAALVGCWDLRVTFDLQYAIPLWPYGAPASLPAVVYPGCTGSPGSVGVPIGSHGGLGAPARFCPPQVPQVCVTSGELSGLVNDAIPREIQASGDTPWTSGVDDAYIQHPLCWYGHTNGRFDTSSNGAISKDPMWEIATLSIAPAGSQTWTQVGQSAKVEVC